MKVVNLKVDKYDVYIGRGSKWGNPFVLLNEDERNEVIEKYEEYIRGRKDLMDSLYELDGKVLGCYCKPRKCHGDVLIKLRKEQLV